MDFFSKPKNKKEVPKPQPQGFTGPVLPKGYKPVSGRAPVGGTQLSENKWKTPSGSIWEYLPDGTRRITLAKQFGGGAYNVNPQNPSSIVKSPRGYGGVETAQGYQRDHTIPVSLGGASTKENIKLRVNNPADLEAEVAKSVKEGSLPLGQARLKIMSEKTKPSPIERLSNSTFSNVIQFPIRKAAAAAYKGVEAAVSKVIYKAPLSGQDLGFDKEDKEYAFKLGPVGSKEFDAGLRTRYLLKNPSQIVDVAGIKNVSPLVKSYVTEQTAKAVAASKPVKLGVKGGLKSFIRSAKSKLVDFASPIEDVLAEAEKKSKFKVLPKFDITNQIDRALRAPTMAGQFVRDNGLEKVIKEVDDIDAFDQYLIAKQAKRVSERGIETGRDLAKDDQLLRELGPEFEYHSKIVSQYSRKILDYSVESGLIKKELAEDLKKIYPDYVPLNRVFEEIDNAGQPAGRAVASLSKQTVVEKLQGSVREIQSPLASLLEKTNDAFKQGEKNKAASILSKYEKLPNNPFNIRLLKDGEKATNTFSVLDNGVKKTYETTKEIADAAKALNVQQLNIVQKVLAVPVRVARMGITALNLPFVAANISRDQVTAFINSDQALRSSIANPFVFGRSLFEAVGHGKIYKEMVRQGAMGTSFDISRNQAVSTVKKIRANRSVASKVKYTVTHPGELFRAVEDIIGRSEELTRIQQFEGTRRGLESAGRTADDATILASKAARENTINFARRGEWGQILNTTFLYMNAGIQGSRALVRNFKNKPVQTAAKVGMTIFTPVAATTAWNLSDPKRKEAYQDISEYEKQGNIIIIPPNPKKNEDGTWDVIKIPLAQGYGRLAGLVRTPIEQAYKVDPVSVEDIADSFIGAVQPIPPDKNPAISTLTPQAVKPTVEAKANRTLFTDTEQVPSYMTKKPANEQVFKGTSGSARKIANFFEASPIKVEKFLKGTFGGVGDQAINATDRILYELGFIPEEQIGGKSVLEGITGRFTKAQGSYPKPPEKPKAEPKKKEGKKKPIKRFSS